MVHVFGTNLWREIPQVSSYPITGKAIFANGCLHWFASYSDIKTEDGGRPVICFDVKKEESGLIDPPKRMHDIRRNYSCLDQVVDLNGEVGYVCTNTMEFWLLNDKKLWMPHRRFKKEIGPDGLLIDVIGCWNKDGDILIKSIGGDPVYVFYVYNLKSGVLLKTNLDGSVGCPGAPNIFNYACDQHDVHWPAMNVPRTRNIRGMISQAAWLLIVRRVINIQEFQVHVMSLHDMVDLHVQIQANLHVMQNTYRLQYIQFANTTAWTALDSKMLDSDISTF
nr:F-box domain-containing protein [Tanacetum cinerariifolium]